MKILMKRRNNSKDILLLPFMAQGHLKPFLELAHHMKRRSTGLTITILTTPLNVQLLQKVSNNVEYADSDSDDFSSGAIRLVELPFRSSDHGLPDGTENTHVLPVTGTIKLLHASKALKAPVRRFIASEIVEKEGCPPLCVIADVFLGWAVEVANSFGSLAVTFNTAGAYGSTVYMSLWRHPHHPCCTEEKDFAVPGFPETHRFEQSQLSRVVRATDVTDEWSKFFQPQMSMSMIAIGWLCNTFEELEPLGMSILRNYLKLPVWVVASTTPLSLSSSPTTLGVQSDQQVITWLDLQPEDSVVYKSFGSQNTITPLQMMELAASLEETEKRFVWAIRAPFGFDIEGKFRSEWLPYGFQERVMDNEKKGAFLSHCGWNSVLESLSEGVPMIGWPLAAEQAFNSKMLEEQTGVAVELARGLEGKVTREEVKQVIDMVLDRHGKGAEMKRKATQMGEKIRLATIQEGDHKGSSLNAMDDFLHAVFHQDFTRSSA